jgi:hypothetical protein
LANATSGETLRPTGTVVLDKDAARFMAEYARAAREVFAAGITLEDLEDDERHGELTLPEVATQVREGRRGRGALDAALAARILKARTSSATRSTPRAREERSRRRGRASSSGASSARDGPDRPRIPPRVCPGCGEPFLPARPNQHHHSPACRVRAHRSRSADLGVLDRYHLEVRKARGAGLLSPDEALDLLVVPRPRVLKLLAEAAA